MRRGSKILITGGIMIVFVLASLAVHHIFFSDDSQVPYSSLYDAWGKSIHPALFGGIVVLVGGAIIRYVDKKKDEKP